MDDETFDYSNRQPELLYHPACWTECLGSICGFCAQPVSKQYVYMLKGNVYHNHCMKISDPTKAVSIDDEEKEARKQLLIMTKMELLHILQTCAVVVEAIVGAWRTTGYTPVPSHLNSPAQSTTPRSVVWAQPSPTNKRPSQSRSTGGDNSPNNMNSADHEGEAGTVVSAGLPGATEESVSLMRSSGSSEMNINDDKNNHLNGFDPHALNTSSRSDIDRSIGPQSTEADESFMSPTKGTIRAHHTDDDDEGPLERNLSLTLPIGGLVALQMPVESEA